MKYKFLGLFALVLIISACQHQAPPPVLTITSHNDPDLHAMVAPPVGWKPDPLKHSGQHSHRVWISPSGDTAYGVIYFHLPLPMGEDVAMWGFMNQMKKSEGEATLLSKTHDKDCGCIRFVAEGGLYKIRGNLFTSGLEGWAVYAGTLRNRSENQKELASAESARDITRVGQ